MHEIKHLSVKLPRNDSVSSLRLTGKVNTIKQQQSRTIIFTSIAAAVQFLGVTLILIFQSLTVLQFFTPHEFNTSSLELYFLQTLKFMNEVRIDKSYIPILLFV